MHPASLVLGECWSWTLDVARQDPPGGGDGDEGSNEGPKRKDEHDYQEDGGMGRRSSKNVGMQRIGPFMTGALASFFDNHILAC